MRIGVPRERTPGESRVALAPHAVYELTRAGHRVFVEAEAGEASSIADARYEEAGGRIVDDAARLYGDSEIVVKVYGPVKEEFPYLREGLVLISFRDGRGGLPVLTPMSEIAGRLTPQIGAHYLQRP